MAKTKTKTKRKSSGTKKISLAIIAGLIPGVAWSLEPAKGGNWGHVPERMLMAYTGYNPISRQWEPNYLARGLFPIIAGVVFHMLADKIGINRMVGRWLPVSV